MACSSDALVKQIVLPTPDIGVTIDLRLAQANNCADPIAARIGNRRRRAILRPANLNTNAACCRGLCVFAVRDHLHSRHAQIDRLGGAFERLRRTLDRRRRGLRVVLVDDWLNFRAEGAGVDDCSFDRAQKPIGCSRELGRGRRMRLHQSTPHAQQNAQNCKGQPGDSLRSKCSNRAEQRDRRKSQKYPARAQINKLRGRNSKREKPSRMEQRNRSPLSGTLARSVQIARTNRVAGRRSRGRVRPGGVHPAHATQTVDWEKASGVMQFDY